MWQLCLFAADVVQMHINTAVWISAHIVSLHEHRQAYNMNACILIFTLIPTKCDRQWNQKIFIKSADEKNDTIIHAFPDASPLLSLMISPIVLASSICLDLHCYWTAPSGRAWIGLSNSAKAQLLSITSLCLQNQSQMGRL